MVKCGKGVICFRSNSVEMVKQKILRAMKEKVFFSANLVTCKLCVGNRSVEMKEVLCKQKVVS